MRKRRRYGGRKEKRRPWIERRVGGRKKEGRRERVHEGEYGE